MAKQNSYGLKEVADFKLYPAKSVVYFAKDTSGEYTGEYFVFKEGTTASDISSLTSAETADARKTAYEAIAKKQEPEYVFDSLKVSSLEFASEEVTAKGGKGNPDLITWYYGKTGTITLTDALLSDATLKLLAGGTDHKNGMVTINSNTFNKGYMMIGDTIMRKYDDQMDYPYLMYIPKASLSVGGTFSLEAEGDPSTFEFSSKVMNAEVNDIEVVEGTAKVVKEEDVLVKFVRGNVGVQGTAEV